MAGCVSGAPTIMGATSRPSTSAGRRPASIMAGRATEANSSGWVAAAFGVVATPAMPVIAGSSRVTRTTEPSSSPTRRATSARAPSVGSARGATSGWAYAVSCPDGEHRRAASAPWADRHDHRRPHGALGHEPPPAG